MALLERDELEATVRDAVARLQKVLAPRAIYLFGSYAYGQPTGDSDLDLLVIVDNSPLSAYQRDALANRAMGDLRMPIDVQVYTVSEFEQRAALPVSFERTVRQKGKIVYAA